MEQIVLMRSCSNFTATASRDVSDITGRYDTLYDNGNYPRSTRGCHAILSINLLRLKEIAIGWFQICLLQAEYERFVFTEQEPHIVKITKKTPTVPLHDARHN